VVNCKWGRRLTIDKCRAVQIKSFTIYHSPFFTIPSGLLSTDYFLSLIKNDFIAHKTQKMIDMLYFYD